MSSVCTPGVVAEEAPLCIRLLRETHGVLLQGGRGANNEPGRLGLSQNSTGLSLRDAASGPPHLRHARDPVTDPGRVLHDQALCARTLIRIAIAHDPVETRHRFLDGDGRLMRLVLLASEGWMATPAPCLLDCVARNRTAHVDRRLGVHEGHHRGERLIAFLRGVEKTAESAAGPTSRGGQGGAVRLWWDLSALWRHWPRTRRPGRLPSSWIVAPPAFWLE